MTSTFYQLAIDCTDPEALAAWWCKVLDYEVEDDEDGWITIAPPKAAHEERRRGPAPPTLCFGPVPESKTVKNRLHLDLRAADGDQGAEVQRLVDLGARHVDIGQGEVSWVVLADPEGNEFCVLASPH